MQEIYVKRQLCLSNKCRSSTDKRTTNKQGNLYNLNLPWTCFHLPFCDIKEKRKNRSNDALVTHLPCCTYCGVQLEAKDDDDDVDDSDTLHHRQTFINFNSAGTLLKLQSPFSCNIDESSSISTAVATSVGTSSRSQMEYNIDTTECRYVSLNSLLRSTKADDTSTTELCSDEFSYEMESKHRETTNVHCICCQEILSAHWKYCPFCGIYLETRN